MALPRYTSLYKMAVAVPAGGLELRLLLALRPWLSTCRKSLASTRRARLCCFSSSRPSRPAYTQGLPEVSAYHSLACQYGTGPESTEPAPPQKVNTMNGAAETMPLKLSSKDLLDRCDG